MKKMKFSIFLLLMFLSKNCFSIEKHDYENFLLERGRIKDTSEIKHFYELDKEYILALIVRTNNEPVIIISNGKKISAEPVLFSKRDWKFVRYIEKVSNSDVFLGDFSFNEHKDMILFSLNSPIGMGYNIIKIEDKTKRKVYFEIKFPGYKYITNNDSGIIQYYNGKNSRINTDYYISFNDIQFCIINNKRGFIINAIGDVYQTDANIYEMDLSKNDKDISLFFYWSASEQRYILDETVTQEQIKKANCPEDYFAYNGLKFSKLDSKLTEEDLKELDKSQLRIMRNAVYARHGRTFKSVDLQSLWECYTWYKKNPNYSDSLLTDIDKYNIELIQKYESK